VYSQHNETQVLRNDVWAPETLESAEAILDGYAKHLDYLLLAEQVRRYAATMLRHGGKERRAALRTVFANIQSALALADVASVSVPTELARVKDIAHTVADTITELRRLRIKEVEFLEVLLQGVQEHQWLLEEVCQSRERN
jgi:hypothetical protein